MTRGRPLVAEPQTASRTQLWSVADRDWDPWLLDLFRVPRDVLPDCVPTIHPFGTFAVAGLEIPVTAVNGDQAAALFSLGPAALDVATVNAGSGAFVLRVMERPAPAPRLLSGVALDDGTDVRFVLEGTVNGAASALDRLAAESGTPDLMRRLPRWLEGAGPPPLFLNGVAGLGSPFWVHDYRSRFVGKGGPRRRAAAVVESIAFLLRANLDEMERHVPSPLSIRITGGLSRLDGLCRVLAGLTGVEVSRRDDPEATARGIAFLAAGRPATWRPIPASDRFPPGRDEALADRYARWREIMRRETGV